MKINQKIVDRKRRIYKLVEDFFGERIEHERFDRLSKSLIAGNISKLEGDDRYVANIIRMNLEDKLYMASFKNS